VSDDTTTTTGAGTGGEVVLAGSEIAIPGDAGLAAELAAERGDDPSTWLQEARRVSFLPGLIPDDFRATNRPTFQQLLEFVPSPS